MKFDTASVIAWLVFSLLAGCSTLPKTSFYTLGTNPPLERATTTPQYAVAIGPVTVPEMIDRPQFVTRVGANQVAIAESARWAEPLKSEIPRAIADNLRQLLADARVSTYPQRSDAETDAAIRVFIDVQRFDSAPGDAATIEVLWTVRGPNDSKPKHGRSLVRESVSGPGFDALVAAHGRALALVSREIAEVIRGAK